MTAPITVDPVALAGMGAAVATDGVTVATAVHTLSAALSGAGALFGHDSAGLLFGQSYTQAGRSLLEAAGSAVNACRKVGFGVQMSAFNYGRANAASTVGGGETPAPQPSAPGAFTAPSMPPPMGSGIAAPLLWTVVESLVGDVWPDGNPAEMRAAAAAWRSFGASIGTTAEPVTAVSAALAGQQIPEAGHMGDAAAQISSGLADIAAQAQELASHVEAFATNVEATQKAIRGLLHQLSISGVLDALGDIFSGENPWQKVQEVADEIKTVLGNMKRQADASRTLFSQSMNALDSATTSLQSWATKEFVEVFGEDVGTALSQDFKALTSLPAGGLKFLGVTAEGLQGLDPMRFAYDPQGAVDTWKSLADSTAMLTNPALLAEKVISDPQGSLDAAKAMVDWEDVEKGDPFRALGYNAAQVGTMFLPGAGEAGPAASAASAEARVAGAEARAAGAGTRDAAAAASGRAASATEGISTKAGEIGSKLDGIKVPEAQPGSSVGGRPPVEAPATRGVEPGHTPAAAHEGIRLPTGEAPHPAPDGSLTSAGQHDGVPDAPSSHHTHAPGVSEGRGVLQSDEVSGNHWARLPDHSPIPDYGEPVAHPGQSAPLDGITDSNRGTWELFRRPEELYGHAPDGTPLSKEGYDERYRELQADGSTYDRYPPNGGAVPHTRVQFDSAREFLQLFGRDVDRIGEPGGKYLGLIENGVPASFEERSLPIGSLNETYYRYRLTGELPQDWKIEVSEIAPGLARDGGGIQIQIINQQGRTLTINELIDLGILE